VRLDGSGSYDPDGEPVRRYQWLLLEQPAGAAARIRDADRVTAYLTPDKAGVWLVVLYVEDHLERSNPAEVRITVSDACCKPVANAGADVEIERTGTVTLDGSQSTDPRNRTLAYRWELVEAPAGSNPGLSDPAIPSPRFSPDPAFARALYGLDLVVDNGQLRASPIGWRCGCETAGRW
jgi:hypothetical protein